MGVSFLDVGKYVINGLIHGHFHIGLVIIPRPILGSRDDNQANMEMPMYYSVNITHTIYVVVVIVWQWDLQFAIGAYHH
jgi:hypothetical protein